MGCADHRKPASGGALGGSPWEYANNPGHAVGKAERRREDFAARRVLWRVSRHERTRKCGRVAKGLSVAVAMRDDDTAAFRDVVTCGSVWSCPVCARKIMAGR